MPDGRERIGLAAPALALPRGGGRRSSGRVRWRRHRRPAARRRPPIRDGRSPGPWRRAVPRPAPVPALARVRQHPYVRLALNRSFSALWIGQLISLFGDRVNQLALLAFVFEITDPRSRSP